MALHGIKRTAPAKGSVANLARKFKPVKKPRTDTDRSEKLYGQKPDSTPA